MPPGLATKGRRIAPTKGRRREPVFTGEGHRYYLAALKHNQRWATHDAPWTTHLTAQQGKRFRLWLANHQEDGRNPGGWKPTKRSDYDMRGFWQKYHGTPQANHAPGQHFTDEFKTPYDTSFSNESIYAKPRTPFVWRTNAKGRGILVNRKNGRLILRESEE